MKCSALPFTFNEKENLNICSGSLESYTSNYINAYVDYILSHANVDVEIESHDVM
jgi:hypothetical protein